MTPGSLNKISELTYFRLRQLAKSIMRRESRAITLSPTALLHEALLRHHRSARNSPQPDPGFAFLPLIMQHVLIDYARRRARFTSPPPPPASTPAPGTPLEDRLAVRNAVRKLALLDQRQAAIVELRVLGGLSLDQIATRFGVCSRTIHRDWASAQLWLRRELRSHKR